MYELCKYDINLFNFIYRLIIEDLNIGPDDSDHSQEDAMQNAYEAMMAEGYTPEEARAAIATEALLNATQFDMETQRGGINQLFTGKAG